MQQKQIRNFSDKLVIMEDTHNGLHWSVWVWNHCCSNSLINLFTISYPMSYNFNIQLRDQIKSQIK